MAERKGKKSQKKAEQVQEMPVLAKNKQDVLELGELDQYYFGEGTHYDIYKKLGAHIGYKNGKEGIYFAVWAPNAASVSVIGEFNGWQENACPMRRREPSGHVRCVCSGSKSGRSLQILHPDKGWTGVVQSRPVCQLFGDASGKCFQNCGFDEL